MPATPNLRTRAARLVAGLRERHRWLDVALRGYARYQRTEARSRPCTSPTRRSSPSSRCCSPPSASSAWCCGTTPSCAPGSWRQLRGRRGAVPLTFVLLPNRALRPRQVLPGAVLCAVWWGLLKYFGAFYVGRTIDNAGEVFGQLAIVVGLLVFINLAAQLLMLTASTQAELVLGPVEAAAPTVGLVEAARGHPPSPAGGPAPGGVRRSRR